MTRKTALEILAALLLVLTISGVKIACSGKSPLLKKETFTLSNGAVLTFNQPSAKIVIRNPTPFTLGVVAKLKKPTRTYDLRVVVHANKTWSTENLYYEGVTDLKVYKVDPYKPRHQWDCFSYTRR